MWSDLAEILQDPSYKRLGLALVISALLHFFLMNGLDLALPNLKKELHVIEARIQMPKVAVKEVTTPKQEELTSEPEPIKQVPAKEVLLEPEPIEQAPPEANQEAASSPVAEPPVQQPVAATITEPVAETTLPPEPAEEPQPVDAGLVINENAYQYVETEFDVRTEIDRSAVGKAKITFNLIDSNRYQLQWLTEGKGIAALLFPDLLQVSEGFLVKTGLQPVSYLYQFGDKADKTRKASFDWQVKKVTLQSSSGTNTEDLTDGAQDLLSFMYQFMYVAPMQKMEIQITNGKKLAMYDYSFEGEENINTEFGEIKTLHIVHRGVDSDEKTELWLALDYQYVPVKIRKIEKNGKVFELTATRINTNRPIANNLEETQ
jgi:Protein of unknown function (DUF3108)